MMLRHASNTLFLQQENILTTLGMRITTPGRKENAIKKRTQMILDHDDQDEELTWHSLPSVTRSKMKRSHNLSESIENNVAAARKHEKTMF